MNICYLKKEMLLHELRVRGVSVDDQSTVDKLRTTLRPLLKMEKAGAFKSSPYNLEFDDEKIIIRTLLDEVNESISTVSSEENVQNKFLSIQSRLVHLLNRVNRIPDQVLNVNQQSEKTELLIDVLAAIDTLESTSRQEPQLSNHFRDPDDDIPLHSSHVHNSTSQSVPFVNSVSPSKYLSLEKWNLKFTGDIKKLSVHNFLERVNELRLARNITEKQLFDSAIDLFTGKALNWFRANNNRFQDWQGLSHLLRSHFEPPDYRARLFKEILERTQDTSETIIDYLSCMQALFRRYDGLSPDTQLDILCRNLSPFYTTQLPVVNTIEELERECLKLEVKKYRAESYVPPSRKKQQFVEPDFAFVGVQNSQPSTSYNFIDEENQVSEISRGLQNNSHNSSREITCWNCQKTGHINRNCPNPRKMHCYRCGTPDVITRTCPKCSSSGNGPRGNR